MRPAETSDREYECPFKYTEKFVPEACEIKYKFGELVWHLRSMHTETSLLAWLVAATWEDVSSTMDDKCE